MGSRSEIDCVLLGSYAVPFESIFDEAAANGPTSGFLQYLRHNSVAVDGRRLTFMDLLNRTLAAASGTDPGLHVGRLPNLASCYLQSFLRKRGFITEIVNLMNVETDRFIELLQMRPRAVAVSTTLYVDDRPVADIVSFIRQWNADTLIVVGGPHIANTCRLHDVATQDLLLGEMGADVYVNESQGELTLSLVLAALRDGRPDLASIPNLIIRDGERLVRTRQSPENNSLTENQIDWDVMDPSWLRPTVQTRTARSCAFKCTFCSHPELAGALTLNTVEGVEAELRQLQRAAVRNVVFIDDTFNVPLPRFKELCRMMIRNGFDLRWFSYFRCANADREALDLMADSGCAGVFLGIESGDNDLLKEMDKFSSTDKLMAGVRGLNERGITTFGSFIVGFPGETDESVQNTIEFIRQAQPRFYRAELWYADPLTPILRRAKELQITGGAFNWKHRTMSWARADEWVRHMYASIAESTILPVYEFDFWSLPYLTGLGLDLDAIESFARDAGRLLNLSLQDAAFDAAPIEAGMVAAMAKTGFAAQLRSNRPRPSSDASVTIQ